MFSLTSNDLVTKYLRFGTHTNISQAKSLIKEYMSGNNMGYMIFEEDTNSFVGLFSFKQDEYEKKSYSITAFNSPEHWNKGYATIILKDMIEIAKLNENIHELKAYVIGANIGSRKVLEKNGFVQQKKLMFDNTLEELVIYALKLRNNEE